MHRTGSWPLLSGLLASAAFIAPPALAQQDDGVTLEAVVVTARKFEENLQDAPVAVSAFTAAALERQQIGGTEDLDRVTPNLQFTSYGPLSGNNSAAQVFIRGIGQTDPTGAVDPGVGLYIDDVYMGRSVGGAMDFRDIAGVQVLRGPQGTLFGRNTIGGAVLMTSTKPGSELGGEVRAKTGDDSLIEVFGAIDIPLGEQLATRFSAGLRKRDGYVTRVFDGKDLGDDDTYTLQGVAVWTPSEAFKATVRADYSKEDENGSPFVFRTINTSAAFVAAGSVGAGCPGATFPPPRVPEINDKRCANNTTWSLGPYTNGGSAPAESTLENYGASAVLEWDFSDVLSFKSITAAREITWTGIRDADNTPINILTTDYDSTSKQFSQEVQALVETDRIKGVFGLFYFKEETSDLVNVTFTAPAPPVLAGAPGLRDHQEVELDNENWAAFSQWTFEVTDQLSVTGGLRYTDETKGIQATILNVGVTTNPDPNPAPTALAPVGSSASNLLFIKTTPYEQGFTAMTGSASVQYRWNEALMTYVSWSQGFKSGGYNQRYNAAPPNNDPIGFDEETAETWELGFKTNFGDGLRLNGALFSTDYKDIQLTSRLGIVPLLFNGGAAGIDGGELEFAYAPTRDLLIEGSLGYLDSEIEEVTTITLPGVAGALTATVAKGNKLPFAPEWQANIGAGYTFHPTADGDLTARIDVAHTSSYFFDAANSPEVAAKAVTTANASLKYEDLGRDWSVTAGVINLTDERYIVAGNSSYTTSTGYAEVVYARPRQWFVSLSKKF